MTHLAKHPAVARLRPGFSRRSLRLAGVLVIGWFLRGRYRRSWRDQNYVLKTYKNYYVDPTNFYKYSGTYGNS